MEILKFKALDKRSGRWIEWEDDRFGIAEYIADCPDYIILAQYIGIKDKYGREIYNGDIVKTEKGIRVISWNQLHCEWALFKDYGMDSDIIADWINDDGKTPKQWEKKEFEVIGSIFVIEI